MSEGIKKNAKSFTPYIAKPSDIASVDASFDPIRQYRLRVQSSLDPQVQQLSSDQPLSNNLFFNPQYTTFDISQRVSFDGNNDFMLNNLRGPFVNSSLDSKLIHKPFDVFQSQNRQITPMMSYFQLTQIIILSIPTTTTTKRITAIFEQEFGQIDQGHSNQFSIPIYHQTTFNLKITDEYQLKPFQKEELKLLIKEDSCESEVVNMSESSWNQNKDDKKQSKLANVRLEKDAYFKRKKKGSKVNDTKNITKNFSKAIISYILNNEELILGFMKKDQYDSFVQLLKTKKNQMTNIKQLRDLWVDGGKNPDFNRVFRIISQYFLKTNLLLMYIIHVFQTQLGIQSIDKIYQGPLRSLIILNSLKTYDQIYKYKRIFHFQQFYNDYNQFLLLPQ